VVLTSKQGLSSCLPRSPDRRFGVSGKLSMREWLGLSMSRAEKTPALLFKRERPHIFTRAEKARVLAPPVYISIDYRYLLKAVYYQRFR